MLDRLWEAVDADKQGGLSEDELLHGLGGAFSRSRAARLRWHWQTFYDTGLRGELGAHAIFALLSQVSSRLYLPYISPYLQYISLLSPPHLPYISPYLARWARA